MLIEDDLLPLSGLAQLLFCERRAALIHVEGLWEENRFTLEGRQLHERADVPWTEQRPRLRVVRGLPLKSEKLKLVGKADVVEFHRELGPNGAELWRPFPVEYKRGRRAKWQNNEVQLCAQAIALEEMVGLQVAQGALYYAASRRRLDVAFDETLRARTLQAARRFHALVGKRITPPAVLERKCRSCSLQDRCLPEVTGSRTKASQYLFRTLEATLKDA